MYMYLSMILWAMPPKFGSLGRRTQKILSRVWTGSKSGEADACCPLQQKRGDRPRADRRGVHTSPKRLSVPRAARSDASDPKIKRLPRRCALAWGIQAARLANFAGRWFCRQVCRLSPFLFFRTAQVIENILRPKPQPCSLSQIRRCFAASASLPR